MSTSPVPLRMVEVSGAEALWLLEGSSLGRLVYAQRDLTLVRPARHVWEYGRLVVRTPAPAAAVPATATYHVDEVRAVHGTGWTVTVSGPADVITDPDETGPPRPRGGEALPYRHVLTGTGTGTGPGVGGLGTVMELTLGLGRQQATRTRKYTTRMTIDWRYTVEENLGILSVAGFLGPDAVRRFTGAVGWALARGTGPVIVDLTELRNWSAEGQVAIAEAARRLGEAGRGLELAAIPADGSLVPTGDGPPIPVHADLAAALAAHGGGRAAPVEGRHEWRTTGWPAGDRAGE